MNMLLHEVEWQDNTAPKTESKFTGQNTYDHKCVKIVSAINFKGF